MYFLDYIQFIIGNLPEQMRRGPVKIIITLGFSGVLALMGPITFIAISRMNANVNALSQLIEQTIAKIAAANTIGVTVSSYAVTYCIKCI